MIEQIVLNYLEQAIPVPVFMEVPENPPPEFVAVEKTGSGRSDRISRATLAVQSWAGSLLKAAELNERIKTAMDDIIELDSISACHLNADYNFTDPTTKHYRYQAVFDLVFY